MKLILITMRQLSNTDYSNYLHPQIGAPDVRGSASMSDPYLTDL